MKKAVVVSGYFQILHNGHIELIEHAKEAGDMVICIVNNDAQNKVKNGEGARNLDDRLTVMRALRDVDMAYGSIDEDQTQVKTLSMIYERYVIDGGMKLAFMNGGDQNNDSIPERTLCEGLGIELLDGAGEKINSSSWIRDKAKK